MLKRLNAGESDGERVAELMDLVKTDWPQAAKAMERLGEFLGDAVVVPTGQGEQAGKPLALAACEKALSAYEAVLEEADPVRLAVLVDTLLDEAATGLAQVEVVDAIGRVWDPTEGTPLAEWVQEDGASVEVRPAAHPEARDGIRDFLAAFTVDGTVRDIIAECKADAEQPPMRPLSTLH